MTKANFVKLLGIVLFNKITDATASYNQNDDENFDECLAAFICESGLSSVFTKFKFEYVHQEEELLDELDEASESIQLLFEKFKMTVENIIEEFVSSFEDEVVLNSNYIYDESHIEAELE